MLICNGCADTCRQVSVRVTAKGMMEYWNDPKYDCVKTNGKNKWNLKHTCFL